MAERAFRRCLARLLDRGQHLPRHRRTRLLGQDAKRASGRHVRAACLPQEAHPLAGQAVAFPRPGHPTVSDRVVGRWVSSPMQTDFVLDALQFARLPRWRTDPPLPPRRAVRVHSIQRATGRSRHRAVGGRQATATTTRGPGRSTGFTGSNCIAEDTRGDRAGDAGVVSWSTHHRLLEPTATSRRPRPRQTLSVATARSGRGCEGPAAATAVPGASGGPCEELEEWKTEHQTAELSRPRRLRRNRGEFQRTQENIAVTNLSCC